MEHLSTEKWAEYRAYTCEKILGATVLWEPYWHVEIPDILHPKLFEMCVNNWPDLENTESVTWNGLFKGLNENRRYVKTNRHDLNGWVDFYNNIQNHPEIVSAIWKIPELGIPNCFNVDSSLWEDYRGYEFENHIDASTIGVAWHIYVYASDDGDGFGTSLNLENGTTVKTFPFRPNFSYFNRVDAAAWHSIKPVDTDVRRSIMTRFNILVN